MKKVNNLFNLKNKNIIVAGGAGQIGFSFVEILADAGANVIVSGSTIFKNNNYKKIINDLRTI